MGAAEIQQWLEEHGGQAKDPATDANGVTVYVAGDGSYIAVTKDGTVRLRGFSPPAGAAAAPASAPSASSAAVSQSADTTVADGTDGTDTTGAATGPLATYTQDQVNARLAEIGQQIGGQPRYVPQQRTRRVVNPAAIISDPRFVPGSPQYIDQPYTVESWYDPRNNTLLFQGQRQADGTFQTTTDAAPRLTHAGGTTVATNTTDPNIVTRMPDGTLRTDPNPNYRTGGIEGKPDPSKPGGYDNEHPVWVTHDASGAVVGTPRELTPDEMKGWQASRAAQQTQTAREPVKDHPGISVVKTTNPQTGQTETHYEKDGAPGVAVQLPPSQAASRTNPTNNHFEELDPTTGQWIDRGPIQSKPVIRPNPVTGTDEQVQEVPDGQGGVKLIVKPIERQGANPATPADAPNVDLSSPQRAYDSFMQLYQWASSKVARGEQTPTWLENVLKGPHEAVTTVLDREKELQRRTENTQSNLLTQRSQDVSFSDNRLSNATQGLATASSAADKINMLAGPGQHAYTSTLLGTLALQGLQNQALGGSNAPPAAVIPGPMAQPGSPMPGLPGGVPDAAAAQAEAERQRALAAQGAALAPVGAGITATNAAAVDPSGANVRAATDAAAFGGLGIGGPPTSGPPTSGPPAPVFQPPPPPGLAPPVAPQASLLPDTGVPPTMALLGSRLGQNPYAYALDALRRHGIGEDSIMAAHQEFLNG